MSCGGFNSCGEFGYLAMKSCSHPVRCGGEAGNKRIPSFEPLICVDVEYNAYNQICKIELASADYRSTWFTPKEVRVLQKSTAYRVYGIRVKADGTIKIKPKESIEKLKDFCFLGFSINSIEKHLKRAKKLCKENEQKEKDQLDYDR